MKTNTSEIKPESSSAIQLAGNSASNARLPFLNNDKVSQMQHTEDKHVNKKVS